MKIRFEKVEIEIAESFVETIGEGLLRLRSFDAQAAAHENSARNKRADARNTLLAAIVSAGFNLLRESMRTPAAPTSAPAAEEPTTQEEAEART